MPLCKNNDKNIYILAGILPYRVIKMELEKIIANIHEIRAKELQRIGTLLEQRKSNSFERVMDGIEESIITVLIDDNLRLSYHFIQPLPPEQINKLSKQFKRDSYFSEGYILAGAFDYVLQSKIAEDVYSKDLKLDCLTHLPGFKKGFDGRFIQEFLIDALSLRGDYFFKYIAPIPNGFKILIPHRFDNIRNSGFEEHLNSYFKKNVFDLLKISQMYVKILNDESNGAFFQACDDVLKSISKKTEEIKQMIGSYREK